MPSANLYQATVDDCAWAAEAQRKFAATLDRAQRAATLKRRATSDERRRVRDSVCPEDDKRHNGFLSFHRRPERRPPERERNAVVEILTERVPSTTNSIAEKRPVFVCFAPGWKNNFPSEVGRRRQERFQRCPNRSASKNVCASGSRFARSHAANASRARTRHRSACVRLKLRPTL